MRDRKELVGMAGFGAAVGDEGHRPAFGGGGVADGHKAGRNPPVFGIPEQPAMLHQVNHFADQLGFTFQGVGDGHHHPPGKLLHQFADVIADAGVINADMGDAVPFGVLPDALHLPAPVKSVPGVHPQHTENLPLHCRRGNDNKTGRICGSRRIIAGPHLAIAKRSRHVRVMVLPFADVRQAPFNLREAEDGVAGIDELAHVELVKGVPAVLFPDFLNVDEYQRGITGGGGGDFHVPDRFFNRGDKPPVVIRAHHPALHIDKGRERHVFPFTAALTPFVAGPERVRLVRFGAGGGDVGAAQVGVCRNRAGHSFQLAEAALPENLINIDIGAEALRGVGVGGKKMQFGAVTQDNRIAGQLDIKQLPGKTDDIAAKNQRLGTAGRKERLIIAGEDRIFQRFKRGVPRRPNLSRLEPDTVTVVFGLTQRLLVAE